MFLKRNCNRTFGNSSYHICYFVIISILIVQLNITLATKIKDELTQNATSSLEASNVTSQQPMAEPLIRFRRQPPRTIVKHIVRPKRYKMKRIKRPKIKYTFAEPPHPQPAYFNRKPISIKKPSFETTIYEDFSHMNVESADFDLPPSSYEAQSMDLDLYKHYEPIETSYKEIPNAPEYTFTAPEINYKEHSFNEVKHTPTYTYTEPEVSFKETTKPVVTYSYSPSVKTRKPHTKYGVPTEFGYTTGYDKPHENKYTYERPASKPVYKLEGGKTFYNAHGKNEYSYSKPQPSKEIARIPATTYGVPDPHIPVKGSNDYNKYSIVEQKPPYKEVYNFAEPPQPEPNVEITYSPSYEINIPSSLDSSYVNDKYNVEHQHPSAPEQPPNHYEGGGYQDHPKYEEPSQEYQPPTNHHGYDDNDQPNYEHTGPSYQEGSDTNQPASYQPAPPRHESIAIDHIPHSSNLPINANHKQPPYDYPKSSYEVPIYDPVPFDASNTEEREIYPPQTLDQASATTEYQGSANNAPKQKPSSAEVTPGYRKQTSGPNQQSPINRLRRRKRKRTKGSSTTVSTTKHILDVPELEEAFEKENRKKFNQEPEPDESHRVENVNNRNSIDLNSNQYNNGLWNPMKIRTSPIMVTTPSTTSVISSSSSKNRRYHFKHQRTTTTTTTTTEAPTPAKVEIISIEKSRSKTYYDGIVSTPKIFNGNFFRNRYRTESTAATTTQSPYTKSTMDNKVTKRTTKNFFDTTIFKSPVNDRENIYPNLPRNHKLF